MIHMFPTSPTLQAKFLYFGLLYSKNRLLQIYGQLPFNEIQDNEWSLFHPVYNNQLLY
jgi:hypothetical protein